MLDQKALKKEWRWYDESDLAELAIRPFNPSDIKKELARCIGLIENYELDIKEYKKKISVMSLQLKSKADSRFVNVKDLEKLRALKRALEKSRNRVRLRIKSLKRARAKITKLYSEQPYCFLISVALPILASLDFKHHIYDIGFEDRWNGKEFSRSVIIIPDEVDAIVFKMRYEGEYARLSE